MAHSPHVSIVCALHNPAYGGDFPRRAGLFLRNICELSAQARLAAEVIFVEWNTQPDVPRWRDVLRLPQLTSGVSVRIIEVPADVHAALAPPGAPPFFQPIAKNVGIRRARGQFVLATDPDVLFTPAVFEVLRSSMSRQAIYRIDRHDVAYDVPYELDTNAQLEFCRRHVRCIHTQFASAEFPRPVSLDVSEDVEQVLRPLRLAYRRAQAIWWYDDGLRKHLNFPLDELHTNASGCFILMSRESWAKVHGHPEFTTRGHSDSVTCWMAAAAGMRQIVLPPPCLMFHQPHSRGQTHAWPQTDWEFWYQKFQKCQSRGRAFVINDGNWGLPDHRFPEWAPMVAPARPTKTMATC